MYIVVCGCCRGIGGCKLLLALDVLFGVVMFVLLDYFCFCL